MLQAYLMHTTLWNVLFVIVVVIMLYYCQLCLKSMYWSLPLPLSLSLSLLSLRIWSAWLMKVDVELISPNFTTPSLVMLLIYCRPFTNMVLLALLLTLATNRSVSTLMECITNLSVVSECVNVVCECGVWVSECVCGEEGGKRLGGGGDRV